MYPAFDDITSRISEPPTWFDTNGSPRWGTFHPNMLGVHDRLVGLFEIGCQSCDDTFLVGVGWDHLDLQECKVRLGEGNLQWMSMRQYVTVPYGELVDSRPVDPTFLLDSFGFGDAPSAGPHRGCAGTTMSANGPILRQAWRTNGSLEWERDPQAEKVWWDANCLDPDTCLVLAKSNLNEVADTDTEGPK